MSSYYVNFYTTDSNSNAGGGTLTLTDQGGHWSGSIDATLNGVGHIDSSLSVVEIANKGGLTEFEATDGGTFKAAILINPFNTASVAGSAMQGVYIYNICGYSN
ncbi:MAG: hypothetical protein AAGE94_08385 [Acidobacteriota bacterium]